MLDNISESLDKILILGMENNIEEALNGLDRILEVEPRNTIALYLKSIIYENLGKYLEHKEIFEKATDLSNLKRKEDIIIVINQIDKCLEFYLHDLSGLRLLGLLIAKLQNLVGESEYIFYKQQYLKRLEKAIDFHDKDDKFKDGHLQFKIIWDEMRFSCKEIEEQEEIIINSYSSKPLILYQHAPLHLFWLFDLIGQYLNSLIKKNIKSPSIFNNKGITVLHEFKIKPDKVKAIEYFKMAMEINPKYFYALNNLGALTESVEFFDKILEIDDNHYPTCFNKAFLLYKKENKDELSLKEALHYCKKALSVNSHDSDSLHLLGSIHQLLGNYTLAIENYDKALKYAPRYICIFEKTAWLLTKLEKYKKALEYLDKATDLEPGDMNLWEDKVEIYKKLEDAEGEFNCYEKMLIHHPGYTEALVGRGRMLIDKGRYSEAIILLNEVEGAHNWDNLWPYAIFHKARAAALQEEKNKALDLIVKSIRSGAALCEVSGKYRVDLKIKELIMKYPEFDKYKNLKEFMSILSHDYNTEEEKDKFWNQY